MIMKHYQLSASSLKQQNVRGSFVLIRLKFFVFKIIYGKTVFVYQFHLLDVSDHITEIIEQIHKILLPKYKHIRNYRQYQSVTPNKLLKLTPFAAFKKEMLHACILKLEQFPKNLKDPLAL